MTPYRLLFQCVAALLLLSGCTSESENVPAPENQAGITITAKAIEMLPEVVTSRASVEKSEAEKKINTLHLFFFDANGNFLTTKEQSAFKAYQVVDFGNSKNSSVIVPENVFPGHNTLDGVQIVAIANPMCDIPGCDHSGCTFRVDGINPGGEICHGDKDDATVEKTISNLSDLLGWYYRPAKREDVTKLPDAGMPMFAYLKVEGTSTEITLNLRPLMARVDVSVSLDQDEKNGGEHSLKITEYVVKNLTETVPFDELESGKVITEEKVVAVNGNILAKGEESELFTYYTYENVRAAKSELPENVKEMEEADQQRWKPTIADESASSFAVRGKYTDHQGITYKAQYTVYLGSNPVDNFEVKRNHCYKNNITISGIDNISTNDGYITFDGRVNVETFNEMYLSIINEKFLDSHWCVIPMDVYFRGDVESPECTVTIPEDCRSWVHLEHCSSEGMAPEDFKAGWGCRDYFTEDMLTNVVKETSATVTHSRDRIYFYVDENASTKPRTAKIEVKYKNLTDYVELVQAGLIPFTYGSDTYYMEAYEEYTMHYDPLDPHGTTGWYDPEGIPWAAEGSPLNGKAFSNGELHSKSIWTPLDLEWRWTPMDVIGGSDGNSLSRYLMGIQTYSGYDFDSQQINSIYPKTLPSTAVSVAVSKNKKNSSISSQKTNWFLPSIDQLGAMMTALNSDYPDFKEYFYWSSNTARNPNRTGVSPIRGNENRYRARATKLDDSGNIVRSEISNSISGYPATTSDSDAEKDYVSGDLTGGSPIVSGDRDYSNVTPPNGGREERKKPHRVRAIRTADGVTP